MAVCKPASRGLQRHTAGVQRYRNVPTSIGVRLSPGNHTAPGEISRYHPPFGSPCTPRIAQVYREVRPLGPTADGSSVQEQEGPAGRRRDGGVCGLGARERAAGDFGLGGALPRCPTPFLGIPMFRESTLALDRQKHGTRRAIENSISVKPHAPRALLPPFTKPTTTQHLYPNKPDLTTLRDARTSQTR